MYNKEWLSRECSLIGEEAVEKLSKASVIVFGIGGVGGYAAFALARAGIGKLTVVDHDRISESNINRQIIADTTTVGRLKTDVAYEQIMKINPDIVMNPVAEFVTAENIDSIIDGSEAGYMIDAIDTVTSKISIAEASVRRNIYAISSMGTGNKLEPSRFRAADISKTEVCPLARVMRRELKVRGILHYDVVFSDEPPIKNGMRTPASISFVPPAAGFILAGEVIKKIIS